MKRWILLVLGLLLMLCGCGAGSSQMLTEPPEVSLTGDWGDALALPSGNYEWDYPIGREEMSSTIACGTSDGPELVIPGEMAEASIDTGELPMPDSLTLQRYDRETECAEEEVIASGDASQTLVLEAGNTYILVLTWEEGNPALGGCFGKATCFFTVTKGE